MGSKQKIQGLTELLLEQSPALPAVKREKTLKVAIGGGKSAHREEGNFPLL